MSSYRGDLSDSEKADLESFKDGACKNCGGSGWRPATFYSGPTPCGCDDPEEELFDNDGFFDPALDEG